jgi:hypothetical protein
MTCARRELSPKGISAEKGGTVGKDVVSHPKNEPLHLPSHSATLRGRCAVAGSARESAKIAKEDEFSRSFL